MKASERRRSSQPAPGTIERLKKLLSTSSAGRRLASPEECLARRQVKVLTRVLSTDKLSREITPSYSIGVPVRRVQSAEVFSSSFSSSPSPFLPLSFVDPPLCPVPKEEECSERTSLLNLPTLGPFFTEQSQEAASVTIESPLPFELSSLFASPSEEAKGELKNSEDAPAEGSSALSQKVLLERMCDIVSEHELSSGRRQNDRSESSTQEVYHYSSPSTPDDTAHAPQLHSPHSPAMRSITADAPTPTTAVVKDQIPIAGEEDEECPPRSSLLLIQLDEIVSELAVAAGSHPLVHRLSEIHRRLSVLSAISDPSRDQLPPPLAPRSLFSLHKEYLTLRKDSKIEEEAHEIEQLFHDIDGALKGIMDHWGSDPISLSDSDFEEQEQEQGQEQEWESANYRDENEYKESEERERKELGDKAEPLKKVGSTPHPSNDEPQFEIYDDVRSVSVSVRTPSLLGDEKAAVLPKEPSSPRQGGKVMVRDLSHELVRCSHSMEPLASPKQQEIGTKAKVQGPVQNGITSPICAIPPEPASHLRCPEFTDYGLIQGTESGQVPTEETNAKQKTDERRRGMTKTSGGNDHDSCAPHSSLLLKGIHANHRTCMRHRSTSLHVTTAELDELLEKYFSFIDFGRGVSGVIEDPKSLFLVPLNDASLPRWIYPGARVKVGRHAPWMQAKSMVISRNHCEIFHDIDSFYVVDVGSTSGTFLNGTRLSEAGSKGQPVVLRSGDILQLGIDCERGANELGQVDLRFAAIQLLVLLGYNKKAVARAPHEVEDVTEMRRERPQVGKLLSWKTIMRITGKVQSIPRRLEGSNVRMWIEHGDLLHTDAGGMAIIYYKDRPAFTAVYNNYKMSWEIAMTDAAGQGVLLLDLLPGAATVYSLMRGVNEMGRLTCVTNDRLVIDPSPGACLGRAPTTEHTPSPFPLTPLSMTEVPSTIDEPSLAPFYTITIDEVTGRMFLVQRFRTSRQQRLLGEALFFKTKKRLFEPQRRILEARLLLPAHHEDQVILGALFAGLLQLERETDS